MRGVVPMLGRIKKSLALNVALILNGKKDIKKPVKDALKIMKTMKGNIIKSWKGKKKKTKIKIKERIKLK